jgi:hypothetical protein
VETFSKGVQPRELEQVLRLEYRSKLLNPKWAQARWPSIPAEPSRLHLLRMLMNCFVHICGLIGPTRQEVQHGTCTGAQPVLSACGRMQGL